MTTDWSRWKGWRGQVTYWKGWAAYQVFLLLPVSWVPLWLMPSVGDYAYWDDAMAQMKEDEAGGIGSFHV
jgi:hypothetical protein